MSLCPCGSGAELDACCAPIMKGATLPRTAEQLMRARYSAHCLQNYEFLTESTHPEFREQATAEEIREWSSLMDWESLEVISTSAGGPDDETGEVCFSAHYSVRGMPQELREDAFFRREGDRWYYVEGNVHGREPVRRAVPKVGRNEVCPCGSGKKYKKCCMGKDNAG